MCYNANVCDECYMQILKPQYFTAPEVGNDPTETLDNAFFNRFEEQCPICRSNKFTPLYFCSHIKSIIAALKLSCRDIETQKVFIKNVRVRTKLIALSLHELQITIIAPSLTCESDCECRISSFFRCGMKNFIFSAVKPKLINI